MLLAKKFSRSFWSRLFSSGAISSQTADLESVKSFRDFIKIADALPKENVVPESIPYVPAENLHGNGKRGKFIY